MTLVGIDPGPVDSHLVVLGEPVERFVYPTSFVASSWAGALQYLCARYPALEVACEGIEHFGMPVGKETFETCYTIGQIQLACQLVHIPLTLIGRRIVKLTLCGSMQAKDPNVRQALLDRFGGPMAQGTKRSPGPLYGMAGHAWSALAVAVVHNERTLHAGMENSLTVARQLA